MSIALLLEKINNICESLTSMITDNNEGYYTELAIKKLRKVFKSCENELTTTIELSSPTFVPTICKEVTDLCNFLKFNVIDLASLLVTSQPVKAPRAFFIGVEKHDTDGFLPVDSHSLKLFDNFVNSIIDGIVEENIIMYPLSLRTQMSEDMETEIVTGILPTKRLFLFLTEIGSSYTKLMTRAKIELVTLPPELEVELQTYLPKDMYNSLPYELLQYKVEPLNGGSKFRRRYRRHHKSKHVHKTRHGRKSKSKPKTHRRRRHSHVRKHKKYTRKY